MPAVSNDDLRATLVARRDAFNAAIAALDACFGPVSEPAVDGPKPVRPNPKRTKQRLATRGTSDHDGDLPTAIMASLRAKSPQRPSELAKALNIRRPVLTYQMRPLLKRGAVIATGSTGSRQFSLPRPAKEAP